MTTQHFSVIAAGRSGSSRLCDILGRHPAIACHQEIFFPREVQAYFPKTLGLKILDTAHRDADHKAFLDEFLAFGADWFKNRRWHGFKAIYSNVQFPPSLMICRDARLRKILLHRDNLLASYASDRLGIATGVWQRIAGKEGEPARHTVEFEKEHFEAYCGRRLIRLAACERAMRESGQDFLRIEYAESLTAEGMRRVWRYLGVAETAETGVYRRNNRRPLLECFSNPDAAAEAAESLGRADWLQPELRDVAADPGEP
ncbi:MAG: hypothetical protein JNM29_01570 [Candidatus Odyssella sp.]|nr:hypothetical protein [Candidatus Odyssella sp.]